MGRLLDVFREHRNTIVELCQGKVSNIILKLTEHGVLTESEKNDISRGNTYIVVYDIISRVETKGTYTEFVNVLNEVGLFAVAEIIELAIDSHFVTPLKSTSAIVVGEEFTLLCELNKEYAVRWYTNGRELFAGGSFRFKDQRFKHKLIIACIQKEDAGEYTCECGSTKTKCTLTVEDLRVKERLQDVSIRANQKLTLFCKLNANCKNIEWLRNGGDIPYRATTLITKDDENTYLYNLEIERAKLEYAGDYSCRYLNTETRCKVTVMESQLDSSMTTTSLLYELGDARNRLKENQNDRKSTETNLAAAQSKVHEKQNEVTSTETEIKSCKDQIKKQEEKLRQRETEIENKENYISELEERQRKLEQYCQDLQQKYHDFETAKNDSDIMQKKIRTLEHEKGELETRVGVLEDFINSGQINAEQRRAFENINNKLLAITEEQKRSKCVIS